MNLVLAPGESIDVTLADTDGKFTISYGKESLTVFSELPDQQGRVGVIYEETGGLGHSDEDVLANAVVGEGVVLSAPDQEKLHSLLKEYAGRNFSGTIVRDTTSIDLSFDSLDVSEVIFMIEEVFGVAFSNEYQWSTVGQLEDYLAARLQDAQR